MTQTKILTRSIFINKIEKPRRKSKSYSASSEIEEKDVPSIQIPLEDGRVRRRSDGGR